MPRKAKPTQLTRAQIRTTVEEVVEELPFIRLESLADVRAELDDIEASIPRRVREAMTDPYLRAKMAEAYARKLRP
jgi:hypothetical protein